MSAGADYDTRPREELMSLDGAVTGGVRWIGSSRSTTLRPHAHLESPWKGKWALESHLWLVSRSEPGSLAQQALGKEFDITIGEIWTLWMPSNLVVPARRKSAAAARSDATRHQWAANSSAYRASSTPEIGYGDRHAVRTTARHARRPALA